MDGKKKSLYISILAMSVLPLFVLGAVITVFSSLRIADAIHSEVESGFRNLGISIITMYNKLYPGDYVLADPEKGLLVKGQHSISDDYEIIDQLKTKLGVDITFFYEDTRMMTTICDREGKRIIGTKVNEEVVKDVLKAQQEHFYTDIQIGDNLYFAYYAPVFNSDGSCIGMIFIAKKSQEVRQSIIHAVMPTVMITIVFMLAMGLVGLKYSKRMVRGFTKIDGFLYKVSKGDLAVKMDNALLERKDEMGDMARHIVVMQQSFKELVEQDLLTKIDNRRCGENKLQRIRAKSLKENYAFAIALGDIDYFKKVNDTYGHVCGDLVLESVACLMQQNMKGKGTAVRWGGEEFLLMYENMDIAAAKQALAELLDEVRKMKVEYNGISVQVTMTFGMADGSIGKVDDLLRLADDRLYVGKSGGRNCIIADEE